MFVSAERRDFGRIVRWCATSNTRCLCCENELRIICLHSLKLVSGCSTVSRRIFQRMWSRKCYVSSDSRGSQTKASYPFLNYFENSIMFTQLNFQQRYGGILYCTTCHDINMPLKNSQIHALFSWEQHSISFTKTSRSSLFRLHDLEFVSHMEQLPEQHKITSSSSLLAASQQSPISQSTLSKQTYQPTTTQNEDRKHSILPRLCRLGGCSSYSFHGRGWTTRLCCRVVWWLWSLQ